MTDKSEAQRNTRSLKIRLAPATYARLEALAARAGLTLGGWITASIEAEHAPELERSKVKRLLAHARRRAAGIHGE